jgi:hypothetical protein
MDDHQTPDFHDTARRLLDGDGGLTGAGALFALLEPISRSMVGREGYPPPPSQMLR